MRDATQTAGGFRVKRLALIASLTIVLTPLAGGLFFAAWWGLGLIPTWSYWKAALVFLLAAEFIYGSALVLTVLALSVLSVSWLRGRHRSERWRTAAARALLLGGATVIGLVAAEVGSTLWLAHSHRRTAVPIGGLGRGTGKGDTIGPSISAGDIPLSTRFSDPPDDREIDVVVLGESSAEGVPYNGWLSVGAIIAWQLDDLFADRRAGCTCWPGWATPWKASIGSSASSRAARTS